MPSQLKTFTTGNTTKTEVRPFGQFVYMNYAIGRQGISVSYDRNKNSRESFKRNKSYLFLQPAYKQYWCRDSRLTKGGDILAGKDNLIPGGYALTVEEQSAGGRKSAEKRREKKMLQEALEKLMKGKVPANGIASLNEDMVRLGIDTSKYNTAQLMALAQIVNALKGNQSAFELIRDTIGEKPVDKQELLADTNFKVEITGFDD